MRKNDTTPNLAPVQALESARVMAAATGCGIYVVDDDLDVLESLRFLLTTEGFDVLTFHSGPALLVSNVRAGAACLVIDYKMPEMNGIDLVHKLRVQGIVTPVVLITGHPDKQIFNKAAAIGVPFVLLKPHLEKTLAIHIRLAVQHGDSSGNSAST